MHGTRPSGPRARAGWPLGLLALLAIAPAERPAAAEAPPIAGQPVAEYRARREALLEKAGDVVAIFGARGADFREFDRFQQDRNFRYLTGIEAPGAILLLIPGDLNEAGEPLEIAFLPPRNRSLERWEGPRDGPGEDSERKFGIQEVASTEDFYHRLLEVLTGPPDASPRAGGGRPVITIHTVMPKGGKAQDSAAAEFAETVARIAPNARVEDVSNHLAALRLVKSPAEIEVLKRAIDITIEAQRDAARAIRPGAFEYQAQAALEYAFARNGAERPGFFSIVGSGPNATIPHYHANRREIEAGDLVVVDIGAETLGYTADLTRTYPASGTFTPRQREVYQLVLDAQHAAEVAYEPGKSTIGDLERAAKQVMKDSPVRDSEGNTLDRYFTHGLGHWLGLSVHDVGDYSKPIPAGAVFTIEPGIYIPEEEVGVRIEDDYLATADGLIKLSEALPSGPEEIEQMMGHAPEPASAQLQNGAP